MKLSAGQVVAVKDGGKVVNAFILRTYTDGDFRAIPESHRMYRNTVDWHRAGDMTQILAHRTEIEYMSRIYAASQLHDLLRD